MSENVKSDALPTAPGVAILLPWLALALLMTVAQIVPDAATWMRYDRSAIEGFETWRILSANFIHLGWGHLVLNVAGLIAIGWLFAEDYSVGQWAIILLVCAIGSSIGLYFLTPEIERVVGLSGALHGLFAAGAIAWIRDGVPTGKWLLAGLAGKLLYEQLVGSIPLSEQTVGGSVVTDAHLWGAISGVVIGLIMQRWRRSDPRL